MVERLTVNQGVVSSSLTGGAIIFLNSNSETFVFDTEKSSYVVFACVIYNVSKFEF